VEEQASLNILLAVVQCVTLVSVVTDMVCPLLDVAYIYQFVRTDKNMPKNGRSST
jgi:hypothetical protein